MRDKESAEAKRRGGRLSGNDLQMAGLNYHKEVQREGHREKEHTDSM